MRGIRRWTEAIAIGLVIALIVAVTSQHDPQTYLAIALVTSLAVYGLLSLLERRGFARPRMTFVGVNVKPPMGLMSRGVLVGQAVYCHAIVKSSATLEDVKGEVIRLERRESSGQFVEMRDFKAPHELRWDKPYHELPDAMRTTIYPETPGRLNLVNTETTDPGVTLLCVLRHGPGMGVTKLPPGDYRLTVRVSAQGTRSADARLLIHAGKWDELRAEMV